MKTSNLVWFVIVIIVVLGGWYLIANAPGEPEAVPSANVGLNGSENQTNTGQENVLPVVTVSSDPALGSYLVASNGMTLYLYAKDTANVSNCYDACAVNWPPYSPLPGEPLVPGEGVTGQLATISRTDGSTQLTYNGVPLYFWKNDLKPGDTTGQNVGGIWFVIQP